MKKTLLRISLFVLIVASFSSCATVLGGEVSACHRTKPPTGEPARELRAGALIADILLFWPDAIVGFATGAIYRPYD